MLLNGGEVRDSEFAIKGCPPGSPACSGSSETIAVV